MNNFAGIQVDNVTLIEAIAKVREFLGSSVLHMIVTPNPEMIVAAQDDQELKEIINSADLRVPDGISMVVVSRILGRPLKERVSGIDLMLKIIEVFSKQEKRVYLLGGKAGIAEAAADNLRSKYPGIQIVGSHDGYFINEADITQQIKEAKPDILFIGLGAGRQERWLKQHLQELDVPVSMTIGGSLDVLSGHKKRAPKIFQKLYIEWLYRLITEPNRWKRQLALPKFLWLMFTGRQ